MPEAEGMALYDAGLVVAPRRLGPLLEIGTYCGKSAAYLGAAARQTGTVLFSIDHHRGSEELQPGWPHHDPDVVDPVTGMIDTLPFARRTLHEAGLEASVVLVVGDSVRVARGWGAQLALLFIDGGHGAGVAWADFRSWAPRWLWAGRWLFTTCSPIRPRGVRCRTRSSATPGSRANGKSWPRSGRSGFYAGPGRPA